jgi:aspartate aminotransferase
MNVVESGRTMISARARSFDFERGTNLVVEAATMAAKGRRIARLDFGEPDFATPPHIVEAGERALREGYTHYTPPGGLRQVRSAVAEWLGRDRGIEVTPDRVVVFPGSMSVIFLSFLALLEPNDEVLVPDPGFPIYAALAQLAGASVKPFPLHQGSPSLDPDELRSCITPRTRMLVTNSPNNPTGTVATRGDLETIAALAEEFDLQVLSDEVYWQISYGDDDPPSALAVPGLADRVICADGVSKAYAMCGWRIGFGVAPRPIVQRLETLMLATGVCAPAFSQVAAITALVDPESREARRKMVTEFKRRRDQVVDGLVAHGGVRCERPQGAFYAFPDFSNLGVDDVELARRLLHEHGVCVMPGSVFGEGGRNHLRLSFAAADDDIRMGLEGIQAMVDSVT